MAIHDLWNFENAPQGVNLSIAAYQTAYQSNTIYNQDTGMPGQPLSYGTGNTFTVSSDGFLLINSNSSGQQGGLVVPLGQVIDLSVATQYWIGFRTKLTAANSSTSPFICGMTTNTSWSSYISLCNEANFISNSLNTVGAEHYVEIFLDRTNQIYQLYVDNVMIASGSCPSTWFVASTFLWFGGIAAGSASYVRGYRDFYFLDVDSKYTTRLGPLRAKALTLTAATNTDWTANGASDILTALNTAIGSGSMTPNAQSPVDKQPLSLTLSTSLTDSGNRILGVQPALSYTSANGMPVNMVVGFKDNTNPLVNAGSFTQANSGIPLYNQKLPIVLTAPNGQPWTAAEINQSQYVLTPQ